MINKFNKLKLSQLLAVAIMNFSSIPLIMAGSGDTQDYPCTNKAGKGINLKEEHNALGNSSCTISVSDDVMNEIAKISAIQTDLNSLKNQNGNKLSASQEGAVMYDNPNKKDIVTLNPGGSGTILTNVKDGVIASNSKDAINGSQINKITSSVADHLGGGASFDSASGQIKAPKYVVQGQDYHNVGAAIGALDDTTNKIIKGELGLIKTDGTTTTIDASGTATTINVSGTNGDRIISGVAAGINVNDAVNRGQLDDKFASVSTQINAIRSETKQELSNMNRQIKTLDDKIQHNRKLASQGIASAMAMSIEYPAQHPGEFATGFGMGTYYGETSLAVGLNYLTPNGKFKVYGGVGQAIGSGSRTAGKIGIGFVW